jgi:hypothetical protein
MERDTGVTVTRESRVSHATTTTPHHTTPSLVTALCGSWTTHQFQVAVRTAVPAIGLGNG